MLNFRGVPYFLAYVNYLPPAGASTLCRLQESRSDRIGRWMVTDGLGGCGGGYATALQFLGFRLVMKNEALSSKGPRF